MKNNIFVRILAIVLVAMSIMAIACTALAASTNINAVNIRKGPHTTDGLVGQVAKGTTFDVDGEVTGTKLNGSNIWLRITNIKCAKGTKAKYKKTAEGQSGYVHSSYVSGYTVTGESTGGSSSSNARPTCKEEAFGYNTLKYGSTGNYVKNVQLVLQKEEPRLYSGNIDGKYGPATTRAVEKFQLKYCMLLADDEYDDPVDGLVGKKTKKLMWELYDDYLKKHGYYNAN